MRNLLIHEIFVESIRFIIVGFINTIHYYLWYLLLTELVSLYYLLGHIIAFVISMIGSFYLNSYFTYRSKPNLGKFVKFPLTYVVNIIISTSSLFVLREYLNMNNKVAPLIAAAIAIPFTFLVSRKILKSEGVKS